MNGPTPALVGVKILLANVLETELTLFKLIANDELGSWCLKG